jgi:hypothetical protein
VEGKCASWSEGTFGGRHIDLVKVWRLLSRLRLRVHKYAQSIDWKQRINLSHSPMVVGGWIRRISP